MTKQTNLILIGIIVLAVGFGLGYSVRGSQADGNHMMDNMNGGHMMGGSMKGMMDGMMSNLKGKTGDAFDKAFLSEMIMHHEGAVVMAQEVLKSSKRPELLQLARDIISAQTREIDQMKNWQKNWFNQ